MTPRLSRLALAALAPAFLALAACGGSETPEANANAARDAGQANDNAAAANAAAWDQSVKDAEAASDNRVASEAAAMGAAEARGEASANAAINGANAEEERRTDANEQ